MNLRGRKGSAAVEFALIAPILVGIASGVADYGYFMAESSAAVSAVRDGARAGSQSAMEEEPNPLFIAETAAAAAWEASNFPGQAEFDAQYTGVFPEIYLTLVIDVRVENLIGLVGPGPAQELSWQLSMRMEDQRDISLE